MFEPILRYLPRYLDRDPALRPALRLVAPSPAAWRVREDRLTLAWGEQAREFDLTEHTLASLVDALQADGFELSWFDQDLYALGAVILWDGSGTIDDRDGTEFRVRTSVLHALTRSLEHEWVALRDAIPAAARQVSIATAEQVWLDRHGRLYGIVRPPGADDAAYRAHLMEEITRPRGNARGIEYTLRRLLAEDIRVIEPWQYLARWSVSPASVAHRFPDGTRWAKNLLHLAFTDPGDWDGAQAIAESDRDAGNILLDPAWWPLARSASAGIGDGTASLMRSDARALYAKGWNHPVWGLTPASDYDLVLNHRFMLVLWMTAYADGHVQGAKLDQGRRFCRGDAVLSEDTPFGWINTRFRGAWYYEALGAARQLSNDLALSDYGVERRNRPICEWTEAQLAPTVSVAWPISIAGSVQRHDLRSLFVHEGLRRPAPRAWGDECWGRLPWLIADAHLTARTEIRICEQMPEGATPSWSDAGALSDYADGLTCRVIDYDPALGIVYPDPYTQQIITVPPRAVTTQRHSITVCQQIPDGATPSWSASGALSDYRDGIRCETMYTDPHIGECSRATAVIATPQPDPGQERPTLTVDRGDQAAIRICRQIDSGVSAAFSGGERLSDYLDRMHCEQMVFDRVITVSRDVNVVRVRRCEQRPSALQPSWSGGVALSNYADGFRCSRTDIDLATGIAQVESMPDPDFTSPHAIFAQGGVGTWTFRWTASHCAMTFVGLMPWRVMRAHLFGHHEFRRCAQMVDGFTPSWSGEGSLSDYVDGLSCEYIRFDISGGVFDDPVSGERITVPAVSPLMHPVARICEQIPDGDTPAWSGAGALSDYNDGIVCRSVTEDGVIQDTDPVDAAAYCTQVTDGASATWSWDGRLSDYRDGWSCFYPEPLAFTPITVDAARYALCVEHGDPLRFSGVDALSDTRYRLLCPMS